eukprot:438711-Pelagomonas_calceolata.AAC.1
MGQPTCSVCFPGWGCWTAPAAGSQAGLPAYAARTTRSGAPALAVAGPGGAAVDGVRRARAEGVRPPAFLLLLLQRLQRRIERETGRPPSCPEGRQSARHAGSATQKAEC